MELQQEGDAPRTGNRDSGAPGGEGGEDGAENAGLSLWKGVISKGNEPLVQRVGSNGFEAPGSPGGCNS